MKRKASATKRHAKRPKRTFKKKRVVVRRNNPARQGSLRVFKFGSPLPTVYRNTMIYSSSIILEGVSAGLADRHSFRCNGCEDPDVTGAGHQPRGWDQMKTLYKQYRVVGSDISCIFYSTSSSLTTSLVAVGIQLFGDDDAILAVPKWKELAERSRSLVKWGYLSQSNGANNIRRLAHKFTQARDMDRSRQHLGNVSSTSVDPSISYRWSIFSVPADESDVMDDIRVLVTIRYHVEFTNPILFGES